MQVTGGADWKIIAWRLSSGEVIKVYSSHSSGVTDLHLEEAGEDRGHVAQGQLVMYSRDKNVCQVRHTFIIEDVLLCTCTLCVG